MTGQNQPQEVHKASEIENEHQLLDEHWKKLEQMKLTWGKLLDSCEAAWESCQATEGELRSLEEVHAQWEPPAENQEILAQLKEMEVRVSLIIAHCSHRLWYFCFSFVRPSSPLM